jgi:uncharacterized HhH-GPD family protein
VPDALHFTGDPEADALIARDPLALMIGFALDQQVTVPMAFSGPRKLFDRLGGLDAARIAAMPLEELEAAFRERPVVHRFPGSMAKRVQALCDTLVRDYGGDAAKIWEEATDTEDLRLRIKALPGFGEMKVTTLGSVLAKRFGLEIAKPLIPDYPTLGDVDSVEALEEYQTAKRAHKAALRAAKQTTA